MSVTKFFKIFSGCQSAHGQTKVLDSARNGKMNAQSFIVRAPLTEELEKNILKGRKVLVRYRLMSLTNVYLAHWISTTTT